MTKFHIQPAPAKRRGVKVARGQLVSIVLVLLGATSLAAQERQRFWLSSQFSPPTMAQASAAGSAGSGSNAPLTLTLRDALHRARAHNPEFQAALTELGVARPERASNALDQDPGLRSDEDGHGKLKS